MSGLGGINETAVNASAYNDGIYNPEWPAVGAAGFFVGASGAAGRQIYQSGVALAAVDALNDATDIEFQADGAAVVVASGVAGAEIETPGTGQAIVRADVHGGWSYVELTTFGLSGGLNSFGINERAYNDAVEYVTTIFGQADVRSLASGVSAAEISATAGAGVLITADGLSFAEAPRTGVAQVDTTGSGVPYLEMPLSGLAAAVAQATGIVYSEFVPRGHAVVVADAEGYGRRYTVAPGERLLKAPKRQTLFVAPKNIRELEA